MKEKLKRYIQILVVFVIGGTISEEDDYILFFFVVSGFGLRGVLQDDGGISFFFSRIH